MRYLKGYKLFENFNLEDLSKVEEVFYSISDIYKVEVGNSYYFEGDIKRYIITVDIESKIDSFIEYNNILDDLEFAVNIIKEFGFLYKLYINDKFIKFVDKSNLNKIYRISIIFIEKDKK